MTIGVYTLLFLLSFNINLILGILILANNYRNPINRLLGLLLLMFALWNLGDAALTVSGSEQYSMFLGRMVWSITPFFPGMFLHFALVFPRRRKIMRNKYVYLLLYLPALILILFSWFSDLLISGPRTTYWSKHYFDYGPAIYIYSLYFVLSFITGFILFYWVMLKSPNNRERLQSKWFMLAAATPIIGGVISNLILPMTGRYVLPVAGPLSSVMAVMISYAVLKYRITSISPRNSSEIILSMLPGIVLLLDTEQRIVNANKRFFEILGFTEKEIIGLPVDTVLTDQEKRTGLPWHRWENSMAIRIQKVTFKTKVGKPVPINFSGFIVMDKTDDIIGLIGVGMPDMETIKNEN
ncbi:MAG: histidine kinase N-terminal 7TM domain-containing protein [Elusimicrobiota bacterium]